MAEKLGLNDIVGGISGLGAMAGSAYSTYNSVQGPESWVSKLRANELSPSVGNLNSFDDWTNVYLNYRPMTSSMLDNENFGFNKGQGILNIGNSVLSGVGTGATFGPYGAIAGGLVGLGAGLFGFNAAKRKAERTRQYAKDMLSSVNSYNNNTLLNGLYNIKQNQYDRLNYSTYAEGGQLHSHGSDWNTGLNYVGNGGSHEENPYDGVPMGMAPDGQPNLVEEGEVIWNNDYVFSKRLKVPKAVRNKYKLRGTKPISFAEAVMQVNKEAEERPNDPITLRGRDAMLGALAEVQEVQRAKKEAKEQSEDMPMSEGIQPMVAANGGLLGHKFKNAGPKPNVSDEVANWWMQWAPIDWGESVSGNGQSYFNWDKLNSYPFNKRTIAKRETNRWIERVQEAKDKFGDTPNTKRDRAAYLLDIANNGKPGAVSNTINDLYNAYSNHFADVVNPSFQLSEYYPMQVGTYNYWPNETFFMGEQPYDQSTSLTGEAAARQRWEDTKGKDVPTGLALTTYRPPLATAPISPDTAVQGTNGVYELTPQGSSSGNKAKGKGNKIKPSLASNLRYIPAIGAGIGVLSDLFGWTNKPDYSQADAIAKAARGMGTISTNPIGDYLTYRPLDRMFALNILNANAGANRRAILDTAGGNRGTAMAGLLASDNNTLNNIGNLFRQAEEYNAQQREKVATFNRATNMYNSELDFNTQKANLGRDEVVMRGLQAAAAMRDAIDQRVGAARSANLTNLFESLGDIGREEAAKDMIRGNRGLLYDWLGNYKGILGADGGKLVNKNKKRRR